MTRMVVLLSDFGLRAPLCRILQGSKIWSHFSKDLAEERIQ